MLRLPLFFTRPALKGEVLLISILNVACMLLGGWLMAKEVLPMLILALIIGALTYILGRLLTSSHRFSLKVDGATSMRWLHTGRSLAPSPDFDPDRRHAN